MFLSFQVKRLTPIAVNLLIWGTDIPDPRNHSNILCVRQDLCRFDKKNEILDYSMVIIHLKWITQYKD
jgi:hypothetical protein